MRRLCALLVLLCAPAAHAYPFLALRPGGTPFEGPTDPELSSIWWNPAALGLIRAAHPTDHGFHVGGVGQLVLQHGSVERDPICTATGLPGDCSAGAQSFPAAPFQSLSGTGLAGLAFDFRSENFVIALAAYAPWESHRSFASPGNAGSTDAPTAYHLRSEDFTTVYFALGAAFRLSRMLHVGVNVALADSWAAMSFDRDAALEAHRCPSALVGAGGGCQGQTWQGGSATTATAGYENPAFAERIRVRGSGGRFWGFLPIPSGLSVSLGAVLQPTDRLTLGLSWQRMFPIFSDFGRYSSGSAVGGEVVPAAASGASCDGGVCVGAGVIEYDLPDVYHVGARYQMTDKLELSTWGRVVVYGGYQRTAAQQALVVRLSGAPVDVAGVPERIVVGRSLVPAVAAEVGLRYRPRPSLRLGLSFITETSAVPGVAVDAEALDGPKIDAMLGVEWRALQWLRLSIGYAVTGVIFSSLNTPSPGAYDPGATVRCVDARYSLDACGVALDGKGLPTASGHYTMVTHHFNVGVMMDF